MALASAEAVLGRRALLCARRRPLVARHHLQHRFAARRRLREARVHHGPPAAPEFRQRRHTIFKFV